MHRPSGSLGAAGTLAVVLVCAATPAMSQVARTGGGDQRAVQQLQQLAQERTALQSENTRLKKELEQAQSDLKAAKAERDALKPKLAKAEALAGRENACAANEQTIQQQRQRTEELVARFRETASTLKEVETDRARAKQQLLEKSRAFDACAVANTELHGIADEVLTRYERYAAARSEPFTKISRIRIENLVDEYRQRASELTVQPSTPAGSRPSEAGASSGAVGPSARR